MQLLPTSTSTSFVIFHKCMLGSTEIRIIGSSAGDASLYIHFNITLNLWLCVAPFTTHRWITFHWRFLSSPITKSYELGQTIAELLTSDLPLVIPIPDMKKGQNSIRPVTIFRESARCALLYLAIYDAHNDRNSSGHYRAIRVSARRNKVSVFW